MASDEIPNASARTWTGFVIMCLGMFMAILDIQIVATSLPTIQAALHVPTDQMVWIQTAYLTAEIVAIPMTGYFTGFLGMRWLFVGAVMLVNHPIAIFLSMFHPARLVHEARARFIGAGRKLDVESNSWRKR